MWDRPNPWHPGGPLDRWAVWKATLPSQEAWPVIWVSTAPLALRQEHTRREQIAAAEAELTDLKTRLASPKSRLHQAAEVERAVDTILRRHHVTRYLTVRRTSRAISAVLKRENRLASS